MLPLHHARPTLDVGLRVQSRISRPSAIRFDKGPVLPGGAAKDKKATTTLSPSGKRRIQPALVASAIADFIANSGCGSLGP